MGEYGDRTKRILYIHQYFADRTSSTGTRSYEFARRLVLDGHQVTMLTSTAHLKDASSARQLRYQIDGIDVIAFRSGYSNHLPKWQRIWAFLAFAARSVREVLTMPRCDVVVATSTPLTVCIPGLAAKWWHRARFAFEVRDLWPEIPIEMGYLRSSAARYTASALARLAYRSADVVVALSPGMADGVRTHRPRARVVVVPNACDIELFSEPPGNEPEWPVPAGASVVLYAGTIGAANDVSWMIDVAAAFRRVAPDSDARFVILGDGAERALVAGRAKSAGLLGKTLYVLDPVPKEKMPAVLKRTTIALSLFADFPLLTTTSPNKLFDALAAGKPVAINYGGWQADLLTRSGAGIVLPRDPTDAANQLRALLGSPHRLTLAAGAAIALARRQFDRDQLYARWSDAVLAR